MIDTIDGDPDFENSEEIDDPGPSWPHCPMLRRGEMLAIIQRQKGLDGRSINLFRNALGRQPGSDLFTHFVGPHLYHPGSHYIYTTPDADRFRFKNWRPEMTASAIKSRSVAVCGVFSNTLSWIDGADLPPGERTYNAGFAVYTVESDLMPLEEQLQIIYSGRLKEFDAELRRLRDYRGYEVVYSGAKSQHFHFCFDLRHLKHELAVATNSSYRDNWTRDLPDCLLRPAYAVNWDRLAAMFRKIAEIEPDSRLRSWEQLRRCPWALRLVNGAHPLGLPSGYLIRQPVLASAIFQNTKRKATEWFHDPEKLGGLCRDERVRRPKTLVETDFSVTSREMALFDQHAPATFCQIIGAEYPKFAGFEINETGFKCLFYNGPCDNKPSSFCEGNRSRILLQGRRGASLQSVGMADKHEFDSDGISIGTTPNQIFDWIVSQYRVDGAPPPEDWIMRRYKAAVHDRDSLAQFVDEHMIEIVAPPAASAQSSETDALRQASTSLALPDEMSGTTAIPNTHVLIRGPQGCGKSTKMMKKIPTIFENDPGVMFFSSPSIRQAEEKIETFQRINEDARFVPYLYLSLTALYERFCPSTERFDHLDILTEGGSSWLHAVYERQREVYEAMFAYRCRLFDLRDEGKIPTLFGTHETMRQHASSGMTRLFYSPGFNEKWFTKLGLDERENWRNTLLNRSHIHRVIVDEVAAHDLVTTHPSEIVEWVRHCAEHIKFENIRDVAERYRQFASYLAQHPCRDMTWNLFLEVVNCKYAAEHMVEVSGGEVPFDDTDGIYAKMVGQHYYVRSRGWWNEFWRVAMLTTEAVPTRMIEAIDRESAARGERQADRFKVYEFGLPDSARDTMTVELQRGCKKQTLPELVRAYREQHPQAEIIADMVKDRISEFSVTTHMSAKGSNAFIGADIIAFYNAPSPALFGEIGALNTRFGRSDLVRLFYTDNFDQTCGRNRGFRGEQGRDHRAVFPPRLRSWLAPALSSASYVGVRAKPSVTLSASPASQDEMVN